jgi:hypothetical protein
LLREKGHLVVAPDLPVDDDPAGFSEYADAAVEALAAGGGVAGKLIVVGQSLAGFTIPLVCDRVRTALVVLVAAMVPKAGESAGEWWEATGYAVARRRQDLREGRDPDAEFDPETIFFHDVPAEVTRTAFERGERAQSATPFEREGSDLRWPDVPTRFLLCREDRFFPADFLRQVVADRLNVIPDEIDGGHLPALARPVELTERLEAYRQERGID